MNITLSLKHNNILLIAYLFILLFVNSIALFFVSLGDENTKVSTIFILKEGIVLALFGFAMLIWMKRLVVDYFDICIVVLIAFNFLCTIINMTSAKPALEGIKLFVFPLLLILAGKQLFRKISYNTIKNVLLIVGVLLTIISIFYFGIFVLNENFLQDVNMGNIYKTKIENGKIFNGFPGNFFSFYGSNIIIKRAFGPFFDPLTLGFFLVPFLFLCRYEFSKRKSMIILFLYIALFVILLLSFTRAIVFSYILICFAIRIKYNGIKIIKIKWIAIAIIIGVGLIAYNYKTLITVVDPSTWGHLNAYDQSIQSIISSKPTDILFGHKAEGNKVFRSESLFFLILFQNGIVYFLLFLSVIYIMATFLKRQVESPLHFIVLSSLSVYLLASITTEHWFATTSCSLFWILLGIALGNKNRYNQKINQLSSRN